VTGIPLGFIAAARPSGGGGGPTVPNFPASGSKIDQWRDNFTAGTLSSEYDDVAPSGISVGSGVLTIAAPSLDEFWCGTARGLDLSASSVYVEITANTLSNGGTLFAGLQLWGGSSNHTELGIRDGNLVFEFTQGGSVNSYGGSAITWNATTHRWLRISASGTTITFETSTNKSSWSNPFGVTRTLSGTWYQAVGLYLDVNCTGAASGSISFDNINN